MSLSDRVRVEGFHLTSTSEIETIATAVATTATTRLAQRTRWIGQYL